MNRNRSCRALGQQSSDSSMTPGVDFGALPGRRGRAIGGIRRVMRYLLHHNYCHASHPDSPYYRAAPSGCYAFRAIRSQSVAVHHRAETDGTAGR